MPGEPILIVDDNPANLMLARVVLKRAGYEVRTAADAAEANAYVVEVLRSHDARVVAKGKSMASEEIGLNAALEAKGCHVLHLRDRSELPEELTPMSLAVLGQLLAYRVAVAKGIDPDQPRTIQKVTRTW